MFGVLDLAGFEDFIAAESEGVGVCNTLRAILICANRCNLSPLLRRVVLVCKAGFWPGLAPFLVSKYSGPFLWIKSL